MERSQDSYAASRRAVSSDGSVMDARKLLLSLPSSDTIVLLILPGVYLDDGCLVVFFIVTYRIAARSSPITGIV